jgi:hypothetical protein
LSKSGKYEMKNQSEEIIVITGSTKRFGREIYALAESMRKEGKFVIDDSQFHLLPEHIGRREFIKRICDADKLLVYNKNGYIGFHTRLEITLAKVIGVNVEFIFPRGEMAEEFTE